MQNDDDNKKDKVTNIIVILSLLLAGWVVVNFYIGMTKNTNTEVSKQENNKGK